MDHNTLKNFHVETDAQGVVTATLDVPNRGMNVFDAGVIEELESLAGEWANAKDVKAVVFRSGKASGFLAGADISVIQALRTKEEADRIIARGQQLMTRIEQLPIPTIAVIHGPCLGGGLEFALACQYRLARDDSSTQLGLPETQLGVIPGWGGTQRLPKVVGVVKSLEMILAGKKLSASSARKAGLVHLAPSPGEFDQAVAKFVQTVIASPSTAEASRSPRRPLLARLVNNTRVGRWFAFQATKKRLAKQARHYPALPAALESVQAGFRLPFQAGMDFERAAFCRTLFTPTCRNLINLFFQRENARNVSTWAVMDHTAAKPAPIEKLGVIGGGAMGAGIAQLAAYQGLEVVLREINESALEAGQERIRKLFEDAVTKRRLSAEEAQSRLAKITGTTDWEPLGSMDAVVEAVVEREDVKEEVFRELESRASAECVLATNTSSLSVRRLAEHRERPERIAGLHFFNPVHRMELVEVVRTDSTSPAAIGRLVKFVRKLGKTPIVVEDSPGFLVNRILFPYLAEAVRMVCEGWKVETIDKTMRRFGMPMGPLELLDQVGLDIGAHVASGLSEVIPDPGPTADRLSAMVQRGWLGKKSGRGFYTYTNDRKDKPTVWEEESPHQAVTPTLESSATGLSLIELRLTLPIINEAARCLEEHVVTEAWMVDLAMVLGTGFAPFRGGPLRLADDLGISKVIADTRTLQKLCGDQFAPCSLLLQMQDHQEGFYPEKSAPTAAGVI